MEIQNMDRLRNNMREMPETESEISSIELIEL